MTSMFDRFREAGQRVPQRLRVPLAIAAATVLGVALATGTALAPRLQTGDVFSMDGVRTFGDATSTAGDPATATPRPVMDVEPRPELEPAADREGEPRSELIGFFVNWDPTSYESLKRNIDEITILMPEWYHVDDDARVVADDPEKQAKVMELIERERPDLRVMPIVNNFHAPEVERHLKDPETRRQIAKDIVSEIRKGGYDGVNIDFEVLPASSRDDLVAFMREVYTEAKKHDLEVSQDVLASSETFDNERLAKYVDYLIPMMYDEHWKTSPAGPISSQGWYERTLKAFFEKVPPEKTVIALGTWTYQWSSGAPRATSHTYATAIDEARRAGVPVKTGDDSLNPTFAFKDGDTSHRFWMLDATTMFNQVSAASGSKPRGYAVWRLGAEDPSVWKVLPERDSLDRQVAESLATDGRRIEFDPDRGLIVRQSLQP